MAVHKQGCRSFGIGIGIILLAMIGIQFLGSGNSLKEIDNNRFFQILEQGDVEKIVIVNKEKVEVYIKPERLSDARYEDVKSDKPSSMLGQPVPQYYFTIISQDVFMGVLNRVMNELPADNRPTYTTLTRRNYMGEIMLWILPFLLILGIWSVILKSKNRRSRVKVENPVKVSTSYRVKVSTPFQGKVST